MKPNKPQPLEELHSNKKQNTLDQIKLRVTLSNLQLLELTSKDQKFISTLQSYNKTGLQLILNANYEQALIYLEQAQKILQYSASCGKTIDRFLIIVTLQNEAAAYQKLWELEKSSDYMQAILYNMNSYLETSSPVEMTHEIRNPNSQPHKQFNMFISKRMDSIVYNLQYSAVSSQIGKHDTALRSAKKGLEIMSVVLTELYSYQCFIKNKINKSSTLKLLRDSCRGFKQLNTRTTINEIRQKLKKVRLVTADPEIQLYYKNFSIGDVMQIEPIEFGSKPRQINQQIQKMQILKKVLYVSISYYAMATELRLLAASCSLNDEKLIKRQNKKSKIYHLNAINIVIEHLPCVSEYLEYIVKSFKNNYQIDLNHQNEEENESDDELLFSEIDDDSFTGKQSENYKIDGNGIVGSKTQIDPFYSDSKNNSLQKKRHSIGRENLPDYKQKKQNKLKKLYKVESSTSLRLPDHKSKTVREQSKKKQDKKGKEHSRSRKSLSNLKSYKQIKNPIKRIEKEKKRSNANSTEKTKDQTKKLQEKKRSQNFKITDEYMTIRKQKTKEKKKKTKNIGEESRKKLGRIKSPQVKMTKPKVDSK